MSMFQSVLAMMAVGIFSPRSFFLANNPIRSWCNGMVGCPYRMCPNIRQCSGHKTALCKKSPVPLGTGLSLFVCQIVPLIF